MVALLRGGWLFGHGSGVVGGSVSEVLWLSLGLGFAFVCGGYIVVLIVYGLFTDRRDRLVVGRFNFVFDVKSSRRRLIM